MGSLKLYFDLMSQPSRALYIFLKANSIPFESKPIALRKGEHMTEEYKRINPFHKVPVIDDGGFKLTESVAMLRYLSDKYDVSWYPKDRQLRARVDEYMAWQQYNTRPHAAMVFRVKVLEPRMKNIPVDQEKLRRYQAELETTLDYIENVFLRDHPYLAGDQLTIADLLGACELMQPYAAGQDVREGRPKLAAWMERVKERLNPHWEEAHKIVHQVRDVFMKTQSRM